MAKPKQHIPAHLRYTIEQFRNEFPSDDVCLNFLKEQRWPGGITHCDKCGTERKHHRVKGRTAYACDRCGNHIYPLAGTIFEKSTTPLHIWFEAMYRMAQTRCGISAKQIQREMGVTYKTAWRMFKQIRMLLKENIGPLGNKGNPVEVDETYHGGVRKGHRGRPLSGDKFKKPIVGMVERKGRVKAFAADNTKAETLMGLVKEHILPKSAVFTDEMPSYHGLKARGYRHRRIKHSAKVYVVGDIHTNTIEGFWSLIKRGITGVYHQVSQKYLQSYLDEYTFRYNRRDSETPMFTWMLRRVSQTAVARPSVAANKTLPALVRDSAEEQPF
jgi:transposase-like protein